MRVVEVYGVTFVGLWRHQFTTAMTVSQGTTDIGKDRACALRLVHDLSAAQMRQQRPRLGIQSPSPPNAVNHFLTRRALDEALRLAENSHLYRITDAVLEVIVVLLTCMRYKSRWRAGVHRPGGGQRKCKLEHVICMLAQSSCG